ncbi:superoxide dismutase family protein [Sphaerimonospora mesophila]|uniref:superoxide dismutase family protein n=1 Tax=Sphaerimonospora mesophila TaxID=37483 RepID=UPI0006E3F7FA
MLGKTHITSAVSALLVTGALGITGTIGVAGAGAGAANAAAGAVPAADAASRGPDSAVALIKDVHGKVLGTFQIERYDRKKLWVTVNARGLTPGFHGMHIHTTGVCDPESVDEATGTPFASAGGHLDVGHKKHDSMAGDLPSLLATADGTAMASFVTDRFKLNQLADKDGSSVVIHELPDNHAHIPDRYSHPKDSTGTTGPDATTLKTGDAGRRIGCGVFDYA